MAAPLYDDFVLIIGAAPNNTVLLTGNNFYISALAITASQIISTGALFFEYGLKSGAAFFFKSAIIIPAAATTNNLGTVTFPCNTVLPRGNNISFEASYLAANLTNASFYVNLHGSKLV